MHEMVMIGDQIVELSLRQPSRIGELEIKQIAVLQCWTHLERLIDRDVIDTRLNTKIARARGTLTHGRLLAFGWIAAVAVSCVSASAGATAMGGKVAAQTGNLPPIVIGVSNVQSGPSGALGHELVRGSQSYFDLVNNGDGGIYGRRIFILLKDDKYEPDPAVTNTNELVQNDKVFFLFDYIGTPTLTRTLPL